MNRTTIEWVKNPDGTQGYTWNPITGCLNGCPYCYARRLANGRLRQRYLANLNIAPPTNPNLPMAAYNAWKDPFYPRFWEERLAELQRGIDDPDYESYIRRKPRGIFVCDMGELFGDWIPESWTAKVLETIADDSNSMHRFYLLTKQPQNLIKFSPFPDNCWVGVTACNYDMLQQALYWLLHIKAKVKDVSIEPFLNWDMTVDATKAINLARQIEGILNWLIIGACTGSKKEMEALIQRYPNLTLMPYGNKWTAQPKIEWVEEIVRAAAQARIPVFLKDNLYPLIHKETTVSDRGKLRMGTSGNLRQEMPVG